MGLALFILIRLVWRPLEFVTDELKIRRAIRDLNTLLAAPWGTYDRFEIRSASRHVSHLIVGAGHPPYWDREWQRAARISEDMRHPKGIGCSSACRHNRLMVDGTI